MDDESPRSKDFLKENVSDQTAAVARGCTKLQSRENKVTPKPGDRLIKILRLGKGLGDGLQVPPSCPRIVPPWRWHAASAALHCRGAVWHIPRIEPLPRLPPPLPFLWPRGELTLPWTATGALTRRSDSSTVTHHCEPPLGLRLASFECYSPRWVARLRYRGPNCCFCCHHGLCHRLGLTLDRLASAESRPPRRL